MNNGNTFSYDSLLCEWGIDTDYLPLLQKYAKELFLFNSSYNMVNVQTEQEIIQKHIFDSLAAVPVLRELFQSESVQSVADVGSGGGLPGIPLAVVFPDISFTLIERMSRRCAFLENCVLMLGLKNITVLNCEAEKAPSEAFDAAVFRAFRPLDKDMTQTLFRLIKPEGFLAAYKAKKSKIEQEMKGIEHSIGGWKCEKLRTDFLNDTEEHERNLVVITKTNHVKGL